MNRSTLLEESFRMKSCNKSNKYNKPNDTQSRLQDSINQVHKKREDSILIAQNQNSLFNGEVCQRQVDASGFIDCW